MPQHPSLPGDPADPPVLHRPVAGPDPGARSAVRRRPAMIAALVVGALAVSGVGGFSAWKWLDTNVEQAVAGPAPVEGFGSGPSFPSARPSAAGAPEFGGRRPSPSAPPPAGTGRPRRPPPGAPPPGPSAGPPPTDASAEPEPGRIPYGKWQCRDDRPWLGRPVLARPCHSLGGAIRVLGRLESTPGIQADVELSLHDARTDELAAGPTPARE